MPRGYQFDLMMRKHCPNYTCTVIFGGFLLYIYLSLLPTRLDGTLAKCQRLASEARSLVHLYVPINGIRHIVAGLRRDKDNLHASMLMKADVHDWTPMRRKSSSSLTYSVYYCNVAMMMSRPSLGDIKPPILLLLHHILYMVDEE
jgi:hypothetical protein